MRNKLGYIVKIFLLFILKFFWSEFIFFVFVKFLRVLVIGKGFDNCFESLMELLKCVFEFFLILLSNNG